jgi:hypothetical protein
MNRLLALVLLTFASFALPAQDSPKPITNADVLSMTKSGLTEQTIILAIQQGPASFDTSPQALVQLKTVGVSDEVLNAMLSVSKDAASTATATPTGPNPSKLLDKALDALGPRQKLVSIRATRYLATLVQSGAGGTTSSEFERVTYYPDRLYIATHNSTGLVNKMVLTPEFNYITTGKMTSAIPAANIEALRTSMQFDFAYVAQHASDFSFSYEGSENAGTEKWDKLRIRNSEGKEIIWSIDASGRVRQIAGKGSSGEVVTELSDYRAVEGLYVSFKRHVLESGRTSDFILSEYEINPPINPTVFSRPAGQPTAGLQIRVLQEQSVPYVQQIGGGVSTSCNISGSANTSMTATTTGNLTLGNATTTSGLHMNCNSYDTTTRWPHVLNAMLVEASDGNAYIIACDRAWRWSKCVPLRAGEVFNARHTGKGMAVQAFNTKGQESEPTYTVLQSKALH